MQNAKKKNVKLLVKMVYVKVVFGMCIANNEKNIPNFTYANWNRKTDLMKD